MITGPCPPYATELVSVQRWSHHEASMVDVPLDECEQGGSDLQGIALATSHFSAGAERLAFQCLDVRCAHLRLHAVGLSAVDL